MAKSGKVLERVVSNVEKILGSDSQAVVETRKKLRDKTNGKLREHDVLVRVKHAHHDVLIALECRDRSRKITVEQIEGFKAKCDHTGVDCGGIVSPKGFTAGALEKARFLGIRCLTLTDEASFRWLLMPGILCLSEKVLRTNFKFNIDVPPEGKPVNASVLDANGTEITTANLAPSVRERFSELSRERELRGCGAIVMRFSGSDLRIRDNESGEIFDVKSIDVRIEYAISARLAPFELASYSSVTDSTKITDVARAEVELPHGKGELMIVYNDNTGGQIVLVGKGTEV